MKILFLTNYFPPSKHGWGYMQLCEEVADGLAERGHQIIILTSTDLDGLEIDRKYPVKRRLIIEPDWHGEKTAAVQFFDGRIMREKKAVNDFLKLIKDYSPDVVFVWNAIGLPRAVLQTAERMLPTVYYMAGYLPELPDEYIAYWQAEPISKWAKLFKKPVSKIALRLLRREGKPINLSYGNVICVSNYVRERLVSKGLISEDSVVIHNGVDLTVFTSSKPVKNITTNKRVETLVAGRIAPEKGVHTVIEAFTILGEMVSQFHLTILGDGEDSYMQELQSKVREYNLSAIVSFVVSIQRKDMPKFLEGFDVLILPSEYDEPLARSMQEAMALGLLVIGTTTGGSGELLVDDQTGLVFEPGDRVSLANQLKRVLTEPKHMASLAQSGQRAVRENFDINLTIKLIEKYLQGTLSY